MNNFMHDINVVLASGSARRKEILESHGMIPVVMPMCVDESLPDGISPEDAVMFLSLKKGLAAEAEIFDSHESSANSNMHSRPVTLPKDEITSAIVGLSCPDSAYKPTFIIAADTVVYVTDVTTGIPTIMGKPKDESDAWRMLSSIRGSVNRVVTGVTLIAAEHKRTFYDSTDVYVNDISDKELHAYIDSGEPFGKAGGYAIQMKFGDYVDHIDGDLENVIGLPYNKLVNELELMSVPI